jgi:transposase
MAWSRGEDRSCLRSNALLLFVPPDRVVVIRRTRSAAAGCPDSCEPSARLHSRHVRRLDDLPWPGRPVVVRLAVRRLRRARRIFAGSAHGPATRRAANGAPERRPAPRRLGARRRGGGAARQPAGHADEPRQAQVSNGATSLPDAPSAAGGCTTASAPP